MFRDDVTGQMSLPTETPTVLMFRVPTTHPERYAQQYNAEFDNYERVKIDSGSPVGSRVIGEIRIRPENLKQTVEMREEIIRRKFPRVSQPIEMVIVSEGRTAVQRTQEREAALS